MRCKNCGWENPDSASSCEKCHNPLAQEGPVNSKPTAHVSEGLRGTVAEGMVFDDASSAPQAVPKSCPKCGYPISDTSTTCPNCNHELSPAPTAKQTMNCKSCGIPLEGNAKFCPSCGTPVAGASAPSRPRIQRSGMGTVLGGPVAGPTPSTRFCTLRPLAWEGEDVNYNPVTYTGDSIILNRANTDPNNNSITSREQAVLTCEDGEWYIENRSELRTTFIRVNGRVKLNKGDIIVLGNREFEFKG